MTGAGIIDHGVGQGQDAHYVTEDKNASIAKETESFKQDRGDLWGLTTTCPEKSPNTEVSA